MGQGLGQFKVKNSKYKVQAPDPVAQIFKSPGLGADNLLIINTLDILDILLYYFLIIIKLVILSE